MPFTAEDAEGTEKTSSFSGSAISVVKRIGTDRNNLATKGHPSSPRLRRAGKSAKAEKFTALKSQFQIHVSYF
jgi:hypothetical protein